MPANLTGNVAYVAAGAYHTCAVTRDGGDTYGTVQCWGWGGLGQTTVPPDLGYATAIAAAPYHNCAIKHANSSVQCWGYTTDGATTPPDGLTGVVSIACGNRHSCAAMSNGTVACWGKDNLNQSSVPTYVTGATSVAAGAGFTCALWNNGTTQLSCWGDTSSNATKVPSSAQQGASSVSAFYDIVCVVDSSHHAVCWGQTYDGTPLAPVPSNLGAVDGVSAGGSFACAIISANKKVRCWGSTDYNQTAVPSDIASP